MAKNRSITLMRPSQMFDSFMDGFFDSPRMGWGNMASSVQVDMYEDENHVFVDIKAPGFTKDELDINIEGESLTVSGKSENEQEEKDDKKYYMKEITSEEFQRVVTLPSSVDSAKAKAKVENGIIKISMPKREESKPQKITIAAE